MWRSHLSILVDDDLIRVARIDRVGTRPLTVLLHEGFLHRVFHIKD